MTYIKLTHAQLQDERWITAGTDAFALHCAAMAWCDHRLTDGRFPRTMTAKVALALDPARAEAAAASLVHCGFWSDHGDAFQVIDYFGHAFPADQIQRTRARWGEDKTRKRQHDVGDHSLCKDDRHCKAVSTTESTTESTTGSTGGRSRLNQTKPNQTKPDLRSGVGVRGGGALTADAERPTQPGHETPADPYPTAMGDCPHMPGGLDQHLAFPDRIRCKDCRNASKARAHAEALAAARRELDAEHSDEGAVS